MLNSILTSYRNSQKLKSESREKPENNCKVTLYRNGFTVDDGQFRDYNDPANKKFMAELNKGYCFIISSSKPILA